MASYSVEVTDEVKAVVRKLPGNVRQRVIRTLNELALNQHPPSSKVLDISELEAEFSVGMELCRIRLETWRIIYLVEPEDELVSVLAVRKRPPYRYEDLDQLIKEHLRKDTPHNP